MRYIRNIFHERARKLFKEDWSSNFSDFRYITPPNSAKDRYCNRSSREYDQDTQLIFPTISHEYFHEYGSLHDSWQTSLRFVCYRIFYSETCQKSPVYPYKYHYCSARNGTKPKKEENKNHVQCPNYCKDGRIIDNSSARDVRTSVVDDIPESSNRFFVRLKHLDVVHVALPIFHVARVVPRYHPALIVRPHHCPYWAVMRLNRGINFSWQKLNENTRDSVESFLCLLL